jgi:hypothetical protein
MKKTIAAVGIAAAASAGALLLGGSPASAETTQASAPSGVAYVQASAVSTEGHYGHHRGHYHVYRWGHHRHHNGGYYRDTDDRIVIHDSNTNVAISR